MTRFCIARMVMLVMLGSMGIAGTAAAQAPGQVEPTSAPFLQRRVPEELATEGIVLSRQNLGLQIEQLGDKWLVSLVDLTTGRVAASTKVDELPADREAAVAAMTHVVAELAAQIVARAEPPPPPATPPLAAPSQMVLIDDRAERAQRELAELKFKRQSIRFGAEYELLGGGTTTRTTTLHRKWIAYQGDLDQALAPEAFYELVGRPDLAAIYTHRRHMMIGSLVVSGAASLLLTVLAFTGGDGIECPFTLDADAYQMCVDTRNREDDKRFRQDLIKLGVTGGVAVVGLAVGYYYYFHQHPIDENDAKGLADAYNQRLRRQLGLPVASRRPVLHDVKLAPYVARSEAGLVLGARF